MFWHSWYWYGLYLRGSIKHVIDELISVEIGIIISVFVEVLVYLLESHVCREETSGLLCTEEQNESMACQTNLDDEVEILDPDTFKRLCATNSASRYMMLCQFMLGPFIIISFSMRIWFYECALLLTGYGLSQKRKRSLPIWIQLNRMFHQRKEVYLNFVVAMESNVYLILKIHLLQVKQASYFHPRSGRSELSSGVGSLGTNVWFGIATGK